MNNKEPEKVYYTTREVAEIMKADRMTALRYLGMVGVKRNGRGHHLKFRVEYAYAAVRLYVQARAKYEWNTVKLKFTIPKVITGLGY